MHNLEHKNNSDKNRYLQSVNLNGEELDKVWFNHDDVIKGGKLLLEMGDKPNKELGTSPKSLPRSMTE
jgi:putative alpha-1,2-mannosidase